MGAALVRGFVFGIPPPNLCIFWGGGAFGGRGDSWILGIGGLIGAFRFWISEVGGLRVCELNFVRGLFCFVFAFSSFDISAFF